nr:hypothetical protein [Deltaproteobacteria bacterium]
MSESKVDDALLRAGGIARRSAKTDPATTGELVAIPFQHPALEGRTVVRLVEGSLDAAVDAEMSALGFATSGEKTAVGRTRKRALGFPAWALVNHPTKARFALEVMREFRKAATRVSTKPGHAKDAFAEIAKTLERSVPEFMPSYWEEVGRVFLAEEATNLAAQCFEKARAAERAYKLPVDEDLRAAAYLEFTAAGAVPAKSLSGYASDLLAAFGPKEAERRFLELNLQRIKAGIAPWTGMAKELAKLSKAAGRGAEAETAFLAEVLASPSLKKAPPDFWASYRTALVRLAGESDEAKRRVLWLFPEPRGFEKFLPSWLDLLEEIGAVEAVTASGEAPRFASALTRFVTYAEGWGNRETPLAPKYFALFEALAPVLAKLGEPLDLASYARWGDEGVYSPDVLETALELGLALAPPKGEGPSISLGDFFSKDPVRLSEHPDYGKLLTQAVGVRFGRADFEACAKGKKGLVAARRSHLMGIVARLDEGALPSLKNSLETLTESTSAATFAEFPEAAAAIEKVDVGRALARSLRGGIIDELSWPDFEAALAALSGPKAEIEIHGTRQNPIVRAGRKVIVFEGRARKKELDLPAIAKEPSHIVYLDGDLLLSFYDAKEHKEQGLWASRAKTPFPFDMRLHGTPDAAAVPGGGVTTGEQVVQSGDTPEKLRWKDFVTDGATFWHRHGSWNERMKLVEFDPATGKDGRASWPEFVREASEKTDRFALTEVELMPLAGAAGSLLGERDGLVGRYVRRDEKEGDVEVTRIDQKTWCGSYTPDALMDWPGADAMRAIGVSTGWSESQGDEFTIHGEGGEEHPAGSFGGDAWKSAGFSILPRAQWLHYLTARDEASSRALRAITDEAARAILTAASEDGTDDDDDVTHALAAVKAQLPGVTSEVLQRGVALVAKAAATHAAGLAALQDRGGDDGGVTDDAVTEALPQLPTEGWESGSCVTDMTAMAAAFLDKARGKLTGSRILWERHIERLARLACYAASRPTASDAARATLRELLSGLAASRMLGLTVTRAELQVKTGSSFLARPKDKHIWIAGEGDAALFARITTDDEDEPTQTVLVLTHGDRLAVPGDATVTWQETVTIPDDRAFIEGFLRELDARGPVAHEPGAAALVASETSLTLAEAALLLAGLPGFGEYRSDFLGKELRETLGLKVTDASRAKQKLRELPNEQLFALLVGAAGVSAPEGFWAAGAEEGSSARALIKTAKGLFGKAVEVSEELVAQAEKECSVPLPTRKALAMVLTAAEADNLWLKPRPGPVEWNHLGDSGDFFSEDVLTTIARLVPYLGTALPVGDAYRAAIPALYDAAKKNLEAPDFLLPLGSRYEEDEKKRALVLDQVGGKKIRVKIGSDEECEGRDNGVVLAVDEGGDSIGFSLRTSALRAHRAAVLPYLTGTDEDGGVYGVDGAKAAYYLLSKDCEELVESVRRSTAPEGSYELDPRVSAKETVASLREATGLDEDAAALYLQMLALPNPTKKLVLLVNGWKPARYEAAAQALVKQKLVIEGKRERAGREIFLPGAWDKKSRGLSMEAYKASIWDRLCFDEAQVTVAPRTLYERAYARLSSGDKPGFEDVTKRKQK